MNGQVRSTQEAAIVSSDLHPHILNKLSTHNAWLQSFSLWKSPKQHTLSPGYHVGATEVTWTAKGVEMGPSPETKAEKNSECWSAQHFHKPMNLEVWAGFAKFSGANFLSLWDSIQKMKNSVCNYLIICLSRIRICLMLIKWELTFGFKL